ncbi:iron-containing alcohol dehydrogenase [Pseudoteredinibacter isoporae]|uniref:iron-containing alcohol dehydrogenase n=1 Tax=Pseudoteredinibacter isoporae TaxID=570281 RepID=UPI00310B242C
MESFVFNTTKSLINQPGAIAQLADICKQHGVRKPIIVTDQGIVACGLLEKLEAVFHREDLPYACFCDIVADPPERVIYEALDLARSQGVDGVIGFGGGSSLDSAKLIALMLASGEKLEDIYGIEQAKGPRLPLMLIPTTAGTGSEATAVAIVTTGETSKMGVVTPLLLPDVAILDAELTLGLPAHITAATGIDAMVHAIEAYTSAHKKNRYSDILAKEALDLLANNILKVCQNGQDLEARQAMLLGAFLAGQAFANSPVAAVHALAYPLGGHFHIPHGLSNSLVLPHVMRFNNSHCHELYAELAPIIMGDDYIAHEDSKAVSTELIKHIELLIGNLKLCTHLRDLDIQEKDLPVLAKDAMLQTRLLQNNPRNVSEQDALNIYKAAW